MKNKFKYFLFGSFSTVVILTFSFITIGKENIRNIYWALNLELRKTFEKEIVINNQFKECLPELISFIPNNSSIVIGHAYGRWAKELFEQGLNPKVNKFLNENKNNIDALFLTGDVFRIPSLAKWKYLYDNFEKHFDIFVAPGNHDIEIDSLSKYRINNNSNTSLNGLSRDLFDLYIGSKQSLKFPYFINRSGFNIALDDSNIEKTILDSRKNNLKLKEEKYDIVFLRHHVMIDKLSTFGGSNKKLYNESTFENRFKFNKKIYFIYGNGGHRASLPRIACYRHSNFTHILNGIGDFNTDNILVLNNGNLYRYILRN